MTAEHDHERLFRYVEEFFFRATSKSVMWPTVRQAARSLGWTQRRVENAVCADPDGRIELIGYNLVGDDDLGSLWIQSWGEAAAE